MSIPSTHLSLTLEPRALVIGTQKGGTTALFKYLSCHPDVEPSLTKEIDFFNCDSRYARGIRFYHAHFQRRTPANTGKHTFDVTPGYLPAAEKTAARIHAYNPDIKLIALLRNPKTRAYSAWQMYRKFHRDNSNWFFQWAERCSQNLPPDYFTRRSPSFGEIFADDLKEEMEVMESGRVIEMPVLKHGIYHQQLSIFYFYFAKEQLLILSSEEMKDHTIRELRKIEDFVGLKNHAWTEEEVKPQFEGQYEEPIPDDAGRILAEFYQQHNAALYALLGRDFAWD